ncbi:MAG TPA: AgmX/PglI C-terminal domain-containing protein [Bdellovibrionota bacterium]|nr:AgmX/PglI C-terminal domain-containing protein [Bdellovibrionota bacterium]
MKTESILVTTSSRGRKRTELWRTDHPHGIGYPYRWVLEKTPEGVVAVNIGRPPGELCKEPKLQLDNSSLASGARLDLEGYTVELKKLSPIVAAYFDEKSVENWLSGSKQKLPALFAYSGVRRSTLKCERIHSAYVGYARQKPSFTIYHDNEGIKIKPLINGVFIKFKGAEPTKCHVGQSVPIRYSEIVHVTVARGWYWWRFNAVDVATLKSLTSSARPRRSEANAEGKWFSRFMAAFLAGLLLLAGLVWLTPSEIEKSKSPEFVQSVKFRKRAKQLPPVRTAKPGVAPRSRSGQGAQALAAGKQVGEARSAATRVREALGGAMALMEKSPVRRDAGLAKAPAEFFGSKGIALAPTEVRPGVVGSSAKVGGLGGGVGDPNAKGVGYSAGDREAGTRQAGSFVAMDTRASMVEEGLRKDEVGAVIHAHMREIRYCYDSAIIHQPKIEGKVIAGFTIAPTGFVKAASVVSSTLNEDQLAECILSKLKTWKFPRPKGGVTVNVSYPFVFKTLGRD